MNECNSIKTTNMYSNLSDQTKVTLNEINKIKDCFNSEIQERNIMSKKIESMHCCFRLFWQTLIVLSATRGGISFFFTSVIGVLVGIASASFGLVFSLTTGVIKKLLEITKN